MKKTGLSLAGIILATGLFAQTMVTGYVYEDTNLNGRKDRREKGMPQVAVSNGHEVVTTNEKGYYMLPVGKDNTIFVVKPSNYSVPLDAFNNSTAFYIHKPGGSPAGSKYKGVVPTGPLPASVDFALTPSAENENFTALVLGDPQPLNLQEVGFFDRGIVSEIEGIQDVSFGISLGDIVWDDLNLYLPYKQAIKKAGIPWYNVMGNHDMNMDASTDSLADETFEAAFGMANYAFNYGKAHFIVLDNIMYPDPLKQRQYRGGLRPGQLTFLENNLKHVSKDKLVVIAFHIPFLYGENDDFSVAIRQKVFDLLRDYPNVLIMSAHTHIQRHNFYTAEDGWKGLKALHEYNAGTSCGDWHKGEPDARGIPVATMNDGTPKGYAFLRITGNQYAIDYKVAGKPADYQMSIYHPKAIPHKQRNSSQMVVNFFMGTKDDKVEYRIGNGKWTPMTWFEGEDPAFQQLFMRWDWSEELLAGRRPSSPRASTHLWRAAMPSNLDLGTHTLEVRATDMFGRTHHQTSTFKVATPPVF